MKDKHEDREGVTILMLSGEFTADHVDRFRKTVLDFVDNHIRDFVLDMAAIEYVDSKGLETMLWLQEQVDERLGQVRLAQISDDLNKVLEMTRLASRFECHEDVTSAITSLR